MNYNESSENLIEIDLMVDCTCSIPLVGEDGTLRFVTAYPAGDSFIRLENLKVPKDVVASQEELTQYLAFKQEQFSNEFVELTEPNIWDGQKLYF